MLKIVLINMPFASLSLPSIGLTQIKSVLNSQFRNDEVTTTIRYLNHDFAHSLGLDFYNAISSSIEHHNSGLGDWFFRQAAFPEHEDNTVDYFQRFYPSPSKEAQSFRESVVHKRRKLDVFLDGLIDKYRLDQANIVGFTSMFMQNVASFALARKVKERNPLITTVMGGANCESPMGQEIVKDVSYIDYTFSGPGLVNFPRFVRACQTGQMDECERIGGVFSKTNCQSILQVRAAAAAAGPLVGIGGRGVAVTTVATAEALGTHGEELHIDSEVKLDYDQFMDDLNRNFPGGKVKPILLFETARGCWWGEKAHCTFCGLNGATMNYRAMRTDNVFRLFDSLFKYSDRCSRFNCVDNILAKSHLTEVFPHLKPPSNVYMFYEVKADLTAGEVETLSKAQVKIIQPGVESLATSTLKLMKKGTSAFRNLMLLKNCLIFDVCPEWNLLVGFPKEEENVYRKYVTDLPLLTHLPPPSGVYPVRFDRYSPYFVNAKEYGLDLHAVDFYELIYPFEKESVTSLAYYFADHNLQAKYFLTVLKWLGKMRERHRAWAESWRKNGDYPKLHLKYKGDRPVVHDTRSGRLVEHSLMDQSVEVLKFLDKAQRIGNVAAEFSHIDGFNASKEVAYLQEKGLLFQEGDRYLSLVLPRDLPRMSFLP